MLPSEIISGNAAVAAALPEGKTIRFRNIDGESGREGFGQFQETREDFCLGRGFRELTLSCAKTRHLRELFFETSTGAAVAVWILFAAFRSGSS